jgi:DNA polymerase III epsilon subunit-like protein
VKTIQHFNGNLLCAIDVETTGLIPGNNEIWQIAVLPLNANYEPLKYVDGVNGKRRINPFYANLKIDNFDAIEPNAIGNRKEFAQIQQSAFDAYEALDLLVDWFERLSLGPYKRVFPLAQNWPFDRGFLIEWMGEKTFDLLFSPRYRDTMVCAALQSDKQGHKKEKVTLAQYNLSYLCHHAQHVNLKPHDALQDCIATAKVYKAFVEDTMI